MSLSIVQSLYASLFEDLATMHPSISDELSRDYSRLVDCQVNRAAISTDLGLYTLDLPGVSKFLLGSLEAGCLTDERPSLCGRKSKSDARPKFLNGLWSNVFSEDGTLRAEPDILSIRSIYQVGNLLKKLKVDCSDQSTNRAIETFRDIERSLPSSWNRTWDRNDPDWCIRSGHPIWGPEPLDDRQADMSDDSDSMYGHRDLFDWRGFRNFVARFSAELGDIHSTQVRQSRSGDKPILPKHGPGAISDKSPYNKYDGLFWTERLESVFPYDYWASPSLEVPDYVVYRDHPSQLMAVPKDQKGPRLIAAEPTANQWIQGFIRRWVESRLGSTILANSIDFRSQGLSQDIVLEASRTQSHATIDLSSASDRLTTRLVEYCFQGNRSLLDAFHACRTRVVRLPDGEEIYLRKFSTQGSAVTFPTQSIVFALISIWAVGLSRGDTKYDSLRRYSDEVRVYGDDIIIPTDAYQVCTSLLEECQLKVNSAKSFAHGKFRESCGMDAYDGEDVTPTYIRELNSETPTGLESIVECSNNLHKAGYWRLAKKLIDVTVTIADQRRLAVKDIDSGAFALASFQGADVSHLESRWNERLHREEVKILSVKTAIQRERGKGHGDLLQFFVEEPDIDSPYQGGQVLRIKHRKALDWGKGAQLAPLVDSS